VDRREAETLLRRVLAEYRALPYPELATRIGTDTHTTITGASGAEYQLAV